MKTTIVPSDVEQIAIRHHIVLREVVPIAGSFGKSVFVINRALLLRISADPMTSLARKYEQLAALDGVPRILYRGALDRDDGALHYAVLTFLPGEDFVTVFSSTTMAQQARLGQSVAEFVEQVQGIQDDHYDIGLYIPTIGRWSGTWQAGHQRYWDVLEREAQGLALKAASIETFRRAFRYLRAYAPVLANQAGPKLLHNDLHPKNILLDRGQFSGVIDWECAQFGEADFEVCHLVHWCLYPPKAELDFSAFLSAFLQAKPRCTQVPDLVRRLTLYQIEHEIHQVIWNAPGAEAMRVPRLVDWMEGRLEQWFAEKNIP